MSLLPRGPVSDDFLDENFEVLWGHGRGLVGLQLVHDVVSKVQEVLQDQVLARTIRLFDRKKVFQETTDDLENKFVI
jgi:hypothetical protein